MSPALHREPGAAVVERPQGCTNLKLRQLMRRVAQEGVNATLGPQRVIALHALIDEAMRALDEAEKSAT